MPHATSLAVVNPVDDLVFTVRLVKAKVKSNSSGDLAQSARQRQEFRDRRCGVGVWSRFRLGPFST